MQQAYLDYAMSVIVSRALPDARDGMKPVHRRILYAMYDMGLRPNLSHKKSARVVGEVLGKYHPHSDTAVYDAMARMAQDFSMRYRLVDGQGNFGSVDGDPPAAMRYTEARLAEPAIDIMNDILKDTVEFTPNFDASMDEPTVLPAAIPNLLVNGATGIAVGMSTNIPPHNLGEVVDALVHILSNWSKRDDIGVDELMAFIKGPDFPTGGIIIGSDNEEEGLSSAYGTGRGKVTTQAKAHIEDMGRGRQMIIVTELPYLTNKSSLIEKIAKLARAGSLDGISDLRDESDRQGMRIVIELSKNADPANILGKLYKRTPMQSTFGIIMLALVDNQPKLLSLKQALLVFIEHRLEIIRRRSEFDLKKAQSRSHILEGLRVALKNLDEVISLIRKATDVETARTRLMNKYKLSEVQANAILDMPLRRLAALERKKIELEYKEVQKLIKELQGLLGSPKKMRTVVSEELLAVKENYGDRRRTQIIKTNGEVSKATLLSAKDLIPDITTWVVVDPDGLISRTPEDKGPRLWGSTAPKWVVKCSTRDTVYLVSETGKTAAVAVHSLPEAELADKGVPYYKATPLKASYKLAAIFTLPAKENQAEGWHVLTISRGGIIKKSEVSELPGPSSHAFTIAKTKDGDQIGWVELTDGKSDLLMVTAQGRAIRFTEEDVRPMGLNSAGVNGIKLKVGDQVVGAKIVDDKFEIFIIGSDALAKRVALSQFPVQGRYGQGVSAWKLPEGVQLMGLANDKPNLEVTIHLARAAAKKVRLDAAPIRTRPAKGKSVLEVSATDRIVGVSVTWEAPEGIFKVAPKKSKKAEPVEEIKPSQITMELGDKKAAMKKSADKKKSPAPKKKPATKKKTAASKKKPSTGKKVK
ncbi:MAG: DNA gyrase subunit A [Chloroflexi bacterium]|nr:DNA gyrase subunit A [Chloroflexota bacterium]